MTAQERRTYQLSQDAELSAQQDLKGGNSSDVVKQSMKVSKEIPSHHGLQSLFVNDPTHIEVTPMKEAAV